MEKSSMAKYIVIILQCDAAKREKDYQICKEAHSRGKGRNGSVQG
jgi:hypothetical protein